MTQATWAEEQAAAVAAAIRTLRGKRSAQWLSGRTAELGHEVTRSIITDLENGRRKYVSMSETVVLAAALSVPPIALLFPPPYSGDTDVVIDLLPDFPCTKVDAIQWFSGEYTPGVMTAIWERVGWEPEPTRYKQSARAVTNARLLENLRVKRDELLARVVERADSRGGGSSLQGLLEELGELEREIARNGG
ncbi:hypothetical protein D2E97_16225 [Mycobacteroides abscessus]|uniref:hypothetical protein n=1 Tax=Mycobacteroides abscessus TaxID=36809 RepID=UPI000258573F|nr:hypothetical protein [Mycobacteroides abscessus]EIC65344.1 hypothetical protein S7W_18665 [Mycobacteroides abscessus M94]PVA20833.1 hypothetical protein DDJ52_16605 [Mycobacteroides abscessus]RIU09128.1 hypothetical protein D2E97_16225 [Mycobacteroides abscessus]SHU28156.1 Putative DNA-binding protein [Mycobacteroides abscessus subsp. abscessus]SKZ81329.1 Putative DNA-binding protein [Mycobacteroides abscessus subsp. abscessus]